ncbi:MAG TPA: CrcB family protein [Candidatus Brocadiia bacterium]|nr:CrcB family protein [Candidatus Brocadiia bacterium]
MWQKYFGLAIAGACGTLLRYALAGVAQRASGSDLPCGTAVVNLAGCFLAGAFWAYAQGRLSISGEMRTIILVGFFGAFTTFSSFMLETNALLRDAEWIAAFGNLSFQNILGLVFMFTGHAVGRLL